MCPPALLTVPSSSCVLTTTSTTSRATVPNVRHSPTPADVSISSRGHIVPATLSSANANNSPMLTPTA